MLKRIRITPLAPSFRCDAGLSSPCPEIHRHPRDLISLTPSLDLHARFARVGHALREASPDGGLAGGSLSLLGKAQKTSRLLRPHTPIPPEICQFAN